MLLCAVDIGFFFSFWQQNSLLRPFTVILCTRLSLGLHYLRSLHVYQSQQPRMYCRIKWNRHPRASSTQHRGARAGPQLFSASLLTPGLGSILSMHLVISRFTWKSQWGSTQSEAVFQEYYSQPGTNTEHTSRPQRARAEMLDKRQPAGGALTGHRSSLSAPNGGTSCEFTPFTLSFRLQVQRRGQQPAGEGSTAQRGLSPVVLQPGRETGWRGEEPKLHLIWSGVSIPHSHSCLS